MPDKEGSEDEKTTKGVVKKKQKQILNQEQTNPVKTFAKTASSVLNTKKGQEKNYNKKSLDTYRKEGGDGTARYEEEYLPEEEYDRYRDNILMRGGDHRSKETKERSYTPSKQPKGQTAAQKAAKGKSALDLVKADITKKYGKGAIMDVGKKSKKKANEELDLTKIAEAFGGYVVEANGKNGKKNNKKRDSIDDFIDAENPFDVKAKKQFEKDVAQEPETDAKEDEFATGTQKSKPVVKKTQSKNYKPKATGKNIKGEQGIKLNPFSGRINPKTGKVEEPPLKIIQKGSTAAKQAQRTAAPPKKSDAEKRNLDPKSTDEFEKDLAATGEPIGSPGMKSDIEKVKRYKGKKAERVPGGVGKKTGSLSKGDLKFSGDKAYRQLRRSQINRDANYQQRIQQAFDTGSGAPRFTDLPSVQPLPAAPEKQKEGKPQKDRPKAKKPPEGVYSRTGFDKEYTGVPDRTVTGGEYGKLRSDQTVDQSALDQAQSGRDAQGNPLNPDQRRELMKRSRGLDNVSKNLTKGALPRGGRSTIQISGDDDRFQTGRDRESITMKPEKKEKAKTSFGKNFTDMMTQTQMAQQSFLGALGGVFAKGLSPATAGAEAGLRYARGDKTGAALSAIQGLGGGIGFGAGVINALRMMNPKSSAQLAKRTDIDPEKEAMASAAGAGFVTQARDTLRRLPKGAPGLKGGKAGIRRARGGGGL